MTSELFTACQSLREIGAVAPFGVADIDHEVAAFVGAGRDGPIGVGGHDDAEAILGLERIDALFLDNEGRLGDEGLQHLLVAAVARKEGFVGEQETAVQQVLIELADQVLGLGDEHAMDAEQAAHEMAEPDLADALFAAHDEGGFGRATGPLHLGGEPADGVVIGPVVAAADDFVDVLEDEARSRLAWGRRRGPARH